MARLRYSPLPETVSIFPSPLLDSALTKMRAATNDAVVQRTLHPPRIPRKPAAAGGSAGSSASGSGQASVSGARPAQKQTSSSSPSGQALRRGGTAGVRLPFPLPPEALAALEEKVKERERSRPDSPFESWGLHGPALEAVAGDKSRVLGGDRSPGQLPCPLPGLSSSPFSHPGIVSDVPGRLSSGSSLAARGRGMLAKGALEIARDPGPCFYSRLFLVEKASDAFGCALYSGI